VVGRGRLAAAVASARRPSGGDRAPDPADVALVPVEPSARGVLANLFQLYRHDMSEFRSYELGEDGTYDYPSLDSYLRGGDREAWFIRVEGHLAGSPASQAASVSSTTVYTSHRWPSGSSSHTLAWRA
jgi:hypothetical protein